MRLWHYDNVAWQQFEVVTRFLRFQCPVIVERNSALFLDAISKNIDGTLLRKGRQSTRFGQNFQNSLSTHDQVSAGLIHLAIHIDLAALYTFYYYRDLRLVQKGFELFSK